MELIRLWVPSRVRSSRLDNLWARGGAGIGVLGLRDEGVGFRV